MNDQRRLLATAFELSWPSVFLLVDLNYLSSSYLFIYLFDN